MPKCVMYDKNCKDHKLLSYSWVSETSIGGLEVYCQVAGKTFEKEVAPIYMDESDIFECPYCGKKLRLVLKVELEEADTHA